MKKSNSILVVLLSVSLNLSLIACGNSNQNNQEKSAKQHDHSEMSHEADHSMPTASKISMEENKSITDLLDSYLALKTALVQDDSNAAAKAGQKLAKASSGIDTATFETFKKSEVKEILEVVKEHGEHIAKSDIAHQREHFDSMTKDFVDLIAIAGTDRTLYQQYCPMYNKGKGGSWLSETKDIKNPLFGSNMLTCGSVKQTISMK